MLLMLKRPHIALLEFVKSFAASVSSKATHGLTHSEDIEAMTSRREIDAPVGPWDFAADDKPFLAKDIIAADVLLRLESLLAIGEKIVRSSGAVRSPLPAALLVNSSAELKNAWALPRGNHEGRLRCAEAAAEQLALFFGRDVVSELQSGMRGLAQGVGNALAGITISVGEGLTISDRNQPLEKMSSIERIRREGDRRVPIEAKRAFLQSVISAFWISAEHRKVMKRAMDCPRELPKEVEGAVDALNKAIDVIGDDHDRYAPTGERQNRIYIRQWKLAGEERERPPRQRPDPWYNSRGSKDDHQL